MKQLQRLIAAFLMIAGITPAIAQTFPTVPSSTVIGRTAVGTGPAQAIPFSQLIALLLTSPLTVSSINTNSIVYNGSTSGTATVSAQAVAGTAVIKWPTTSGTVATTGTSPIVLNAVTGAVSCPTCAVQLTTRTAAIAANLSSFSVVSTAGYATAGDGGGATFKNVGTSAFYDSFIATGSITAAGTGYTNGSYIGVTLTGGAGKGAFANITVAGGVVTAVTITGTGGTAYTVADALSAAAASIGGTGSGFTWTVATVTTPTCSFTDSVGTHFQMVPDSSDAINVRQCGAKLDWTGTDGTATNDYQAIQNALSFASRVIGPTIDGGGIAGAKVIVPKGTALVCGGSNTLLVPGSTILSGMGPFNTTLKLCDSGQNAATHFITLCDPASHLACFGGQITNIALFSTSTPAANSNVSMIFTNSQQQLKGVDRVAVYSGKRLCLYTDVGYGGAANFVVDSLFCTPNGTSVNAGVSIGYTSAVTTMRDTIIESSGWAGPALQFFGGVLGIDGFHVEGITTGINTNITGALTNGTVRIHNITGGNSCTDLIVKQIGSVNNNMVVGMATPNGCTNTVNDGGALTTGVIVADTLF